MTDIMSQAEFARHIDRSRSYITSLKGQGRLVMTEDGKRVRVAESIKRIAETKDLNRDDVTQRHAVGRGEEPANGRDVDPSFTQAKAKKEHYLALQAKLEYEKASGKAVDIDTVIRVMGDAVALVNSQMENLEDTLTNQVFGLNDKTAVRARIRSEIERLRHAIAHEFGAVAEKSKST